VKAQVTVVNASVGQSACPSAHAERVAHSRDPSSLNVAYAGL
jgi:hypothetical protein